MPIQAVKHYGHVKTPAEACIKAEYGTCKGCHTNNHKYFNRVQTSKKEEWTINSHY